MGFGLMYWVLESLRDAIVFHRGSLLKCFFSPDSVSLGLRLLVVGILILFGTYLHSIRKPKIVSLPDQDAAFDTDRVLLAGIGFSGLYWILESIRDAVFISKASIFERLFFPEAMSFWTRALAVSILILFMIYAKTLIDQRKHIEGALRRSEERLKQILQQMPYPIQAFSLDGTACIVNRAYLEAFEIRSPDDIIGKYNICQDPLMEKSNISRRFHEALQGHTVIIPELAIQSVDSSTDSALTEKVFEMTLFPVFRSPEEIWRVVSIWKDITDRKSTEREKQKIQTQLLQSQKMQAVGLLAGGIAHDFNNILTAIQGSADLALLDVLPEDSVFKDLTDIKAAAESAAELTHQLLLFSRKHPIGLSSFNMNDCLKSLTKMIARLIGEDIKVDLDLQSDLWSTNADRSTMEQVLMNLVVNARDAMPEGGILTIKTKNTILTAKTCMQIEDSRPGRFIMLSIRDNGTGMKQSVITHIFEPFFTTKEAGTGTGLGLSVAYGIIKQHGGWINVESMAGKGSTFTIYLPVTASQSEDEKPKERLSPSELRGCGERLLIVEDNKNVRDFAIDALQTSGYEVFSATNAKEALALFDSKQGDFDMVLCDVVLPDKSGIELVEELKSRKPVVRVLLGSGYMDQKSQWRLIQDRGLRFIRKPFSLVDLLGAVKDVISPTSYSSKQPPA